MITCPECGQAAAENTKFCDRCGRGLDAAAEAPAPATRPSPLAVGTVLRGEFRISEISSQTTIENRYRARSAAAGNSDAFIIRERFGPIAEIAEAEALAIDPPLLAPAPAPAQSEDPNGPRAKTAELAPPASSNGSTTDNDSSEVAAIAAPDSALAAQPAQADGDGVAEGLTEAVAPAAPAVVAQTVEAAPDADAVDTPRTQDDLGEVFGRVMALSTMLEHPAFERAIGGFADSDRVYLVYRDEQLRPVNRAGKPMNEAEAIAAAIQVCQAVSYAHRRGLRVNDICPESVAIAESTRRVKLSGLDYISNDTELQTEPIFNDGYTAPEIYRGKRTDKRADVFSCGALLYAWLTGERIEVESWREEAGPVRFYPPYVISPRLEVAVRRAIAFDPRDRWPSIDEFKNALAALSNAIDIRSAALSDVGMVREHNEDSVMALEYTRVSIVDPAHAYLYVVADGMGGAEAGEMASVIAVHAIHKHYVDAVTADALQDLGAIVTAGLEDANSAILDYVVSHPESRGMGSTGVAALIIPPTCAIGWVGDSRAYILGGGVLRQITRDHSLVQRLIEIGQITHEEARNHEHKNVITRSLGARASGPAGAEALTLKLKRGDRLVLCSDGLTTHVEDAQLAEILARATDPYGAARELIAAANAGGGTDNVSVVTVFAS
jgi:serine/threonine protein phosphatase PrpC